MDLLPRPAPRNAARELSAEELDALAAGAVLVVAGPDGAAARPLREWTPKELSNALPVRRLGSYAKARSNLALHAVPHRGGFRHVWAESLLELAWLRELDRDWSVRAYETQAAVIYFPLDGKCVWHVPDILGIEATGAPGFYCVKPDEHYAASWRYRQICDLISLACRRAGWGFRQLGTMPARRVANLSQLQLDKHGVAESLVPQVQQVREGRPLTAGEVIDPQEPAAGLVVLRHLLGSGEVHADLDRAMGLETVLGWEGQEPVSTSKQDVVELRVGSQWLVNAVQEVVEKVGYVQQELQVRVRTLDGVSEQHPLEAARRALHSAHAPSPEADIRPELMSRWRQATPQAKAKARRMQRMLYLWKFGVEPGTWLPAKGYDLKDETSRRIKVQRDFKIDRSTLFRQHAKYKKFGLPGLLHGRIGSGSGDPLEGLDPELVEAARGFLVVTAATDARRDAVQNRVLLHKHLEERNFQDLDEKLVELLYDECGRGLGLDGTSDTRKAIVNGRPRKGRRVEDYLPGERVEMDSTAANLALWMPGEDFDKVTRGSVVAALDVGTGIAHGRLGVGAPTGRDAGLVMADLCIVPEAWQHDAAAWEHFVGLPAAVGLHENLCLQVSSVGLDNGREFMNYFFLSLLAGLGIDILIASVRDPLFKAHVESLMNAIDKQAQASKAYLGNSVKHRHLVMPPPELRPTHAQAAEDLRTLLHVVHNRQPRRAHPLASDHMLTPYERRALDLANGAPLRLAPDKVKVYGFLPTVAITVQRSEARGLNRRYWSPIVEDLYQRSAGDVRRARRRLEAHYDPYAPNTLIVRIPGTYEYVPLHAIGPDGEQLPNFGDIVAKRAMKFAGVKGTNKSLDYLTKRNVVDYVQSTLEGKDRVLKGELAEDFIRGRLAIPAPTPGGTPVLGPPIDALEAAGAPLPIVEADGATHVPLFDLAKLNRPTTAATGQPDLDELSDEDFFDPRRVYSQAAAVRDEI